MQECDTDTGTFGQTWSGPRGYGGHRDIQWWTPLRVRQAQQPVSKRALCRKEGTRYKTLGKVLSHSEPSGYRRAAPYAEPNLGSLSFLLFGAFVAWCDQNL